MKVEQIKMTERKKNLLLDFEEKGCSDDDFVDFCKEHKIDLKEAYIMISMKYAPKQCEGCKHIGMYGTRGDIYPCNVCLRNCKDMYE